jgi:hypothetical protein
MTEPGSGSPVPVTRNSARPDIVTVVLLNVTKDFTASRMSRVCAVSSSGESRATPSKVCSHRPRRNSRRANGRPHFLVEDGLIKFEFSRICRIHRQKPTDNLRRSAFHWNG